MLLRLLASVALICIASLPARAEPPLLALVIGNGRYVSPLPSIPACAASVSVIASALRDHGAEVIERVDTTNGEMQGTINVFKQRLADVPDAPMLVYICGHVLDVDGRAFLLPSSTALRSDFDALSQGVVARGLVRLTKQVDARAGVLLLDAFATAESKQSRALGPTLDEIRGGIGYIAVAEALGQTGPTALGQVLLTTLADPNATTRSVIQTLQGNLQVHQFATITALRSPAFMKSLFVQASPSARADSRPVSTRVAAPPASQQGTPQPSPSVATVQPSGSGSATIDMPEPARAPLSLSPPAAFSAAPNPKPVETLRRSRGQTSPDSHSESHLQPASPPSPGAAAPSPKQTEPGPALAPELRRKLQNAVRSSRPEDAEGTGRLARAPAEASPGSQENTPSKDRESASKNRTSEAAKPPPKTSNTVRALRGMEEDLPQ
jgi:hypothetical protein